jgi:hypothetical protein
VNEINFTTYQPGQVYGETDFDLSLDNLGGQLRNGARYVDTSWHFCVIRGCGSVEESNTALLTTLLRSRYANIARAMVSDVASADVPAARRVGAERHQRRVRSALDIIDEHPVVAVGDEA